MARLRNTARNRLPSKFLNSTVGCPGKNSSSGDGEAQDKAAVSIPKGSREPRRDRQGSWEPSQPDRARPKQLIHRVRRIIWSHGAFLQPRVAFCVSPVN